MMHADARKLLHFWTKQSIGYLKDHIDDLKRIANDGSDGSDKDQKLMKDCVAYLWCTLDTEMKEAIELEKDLGFKERQQ